MDRESALWRVSSYSGGGNNCVEIAPAASGWRVRDTKDRAGGALAVPAESWRVFLERVAAG